MLFDFIIVGAGTAGSVLAHRLSEQGRFAVALVEDGPDSRHELLLVPAGFNYVAFDPRFIWDYKTEPEPGLGGRVIDYMRGRVLGGSSSVNAMIHVRGNPRDYDDWAAAGCPGWGWQDVLPYFQRSETHESPAPAHGRSGPVRVSGCQRHPASDAFIAAMRQTGVPDNPDFDGERQEGAGYYSQTVHQGRRQSTAATYLAQARGRHNLHVFTGLLADRVEFEQGRARSLVVHDGNGGTLQLRASREILLCAGTVGSANLLERSGIGDARHLSSLGIAPVVDRPAVGENVQDHYHAPVVMQVEGGQPTLNRYRSRWRLAGQILRYYFRRDGLLAFNGMQAGGFVRSRPDLDRPDLQVFFSPAALVPGVWPRQLHPLPGLTSIVYPLRPAARGSVHIRDSGAASAPRIRGNYLGTDADARALMNGVRYVQRVFAQPAFEPFRLREIAPGLGAGSDEALLEHCRQKGDSVHHPVGSCRMGSDDQAVVDPELRVRGVRGLRVADASIMPTLVGGNTNAATLMIGERASELVAREHAA